MSRRFSVCLILLAALAFVPAASAAYPAPYAVQGGAGLPSLDGSLHFIAQAAGSNTRIDASNGDATVMSRTVHGAFGVATLTQTGLAGGLFHDGSAFVLQNLGLKSTSSFMVVGTKDLVPHETITLKGTFGFDALSPDGSRLYLIQHTSTSDIEHYVVRGYDLGAHKLLPGRIADKTQKSWVMQGWAVDRVTTADGRWAYTLYANPGGYPFIHALDTVRGVAHCVGLPWTATDQSPVYDFRLSLQGASLAVNWQDGHTYRLVDTTSWRVSTK
jgi:hypothetical protein